MSKTFNYEETLELLQKHGQTHLLNHYNSLTEEEKQSLLSQINNIDFYMMNQLYAISMDKISNIKETDVIEPIGYVNSADYKNNEHYMSIGKKILDENALAVVTMAGRPRYKTWP